MPKRRLYDPILVEDNLERGNDKAAATTNKQSPGADTTSSRKARRKNAANKKRQSLKPSLPIVPVAPISSGKNKGSRRSSQILVKLSDACRNHQNDTHPSRQRDGQGNDGNAAVDNHRTNRLDTNDADVPVPCQSALSKLKSLLPKLQREIPPVAWSAETELLPDEESPAVLEDVSLLCDFYISVLSGYYCPHLPRLFHQGHHVGSILDVVQYLLRHLLNPSLLNGLSIAPDVASNDEEGQQRAGDPVERSSVPLESFEKISDTVSRFLAFLVDDATSGLHKAICVDLMDALEDFSVLQTMGLHHPQSPLPVRLILFHETSSIARKQSLSHCPTGESYECVLDLHQWQEIYVLQSAFLRVLHSVVAQFATGRHQELPDSVARLDAVGGTNGLQATSPSPSSSGVVDLTFPPDVVQDGIRVHTLLRGLKAVVCLTFSDSKNLAVSSSQSQVIGPKTCPLEIQRKMEAFKVLMMLQNDWKGLGRTNASVSHAIMLEASMLGIKAIVAFRDHPQSSMSLQSRCEATVHKLLTRLVLDAKSLHDDATTFVLHTQLLPHLLDGLNATDYEELDGGFWSKNLELAFLKVLHFIITSNPELARPSTQYFLAHGLFRDMIYLLLRSCSRTSHLFCRLAAQVRYWVIQVIASTLVTGFKMNPAIEESQTKFHLDQILLKGLDHYSESVESPDSVQATAHKRELNGTSDSVSMEVPAPPLRIYPAMGPIDRWALHSSRDVKVWDVPASWRDGVGFLITRALASVKLLSLHAGNSNQVMGDVEANLSVVTSCFLLLMNLARCEHFRSSTMLRVANLLSSSLLPYCTNQRMTTPGTQLYALEFVKADVIVQCGLAIHFSHLLVIDNNDESNKYIRRLFQVSSVESFGILESAVLSDLDKEFVCLRYLGLPSYLTSIASKLGKEPECTEAWSDENFSEFSPSADLYNLPLMIKAGLLVALSTSENWTARSLADKIMNDIKKNAAVCHPRGDITRTASVLLHTLPLFYFATLEKFAARDRTSVSSEVALMVFKEILVPVFHCVDKFPESVATPFYFALHQIHSAIIGRPVVDIRDPAAVMKMLSVRHGSLRTACVEIEIIGSSSEVVFEILRKTQPRGMDSTARYLLWMVMSSCNRVSTPASSIMQSSQESAVKRIMEIPFVDSDHRVRELLKIEAATWWAELAYNHIIAGLSSNGSFGTMVPNGEGAIVVEKLSGPSTNESSVVDGLLDLVDNEIKDCSDQHNTQLSLSVGATSGVSSSNTSLSAKRFAWQRQATTLLAGICCNAQYGDHVIASVFEESLLRLLRLWYASSLEKTFGVIFPAPLSVSGSNALAFGCLSILADICDLSIVFSTRKSWTCFPRALFADLQTLNPHGISEELCFQAERMIRMLFSLCEDTISCKGDVSRAYNTLSVQLSQILSQVLVGDEEEVLRFVVQLFCFLRARKKLSLSRVDRPMEVVGSSTVTTNSVPRTAGIPMEDLEMYKFLKDFCLGNIDVILPALLLPSRHESLKFLSKITGLTLGEMIRNREQGILKGVVWELGRDPCTSVGAIVALKSAALARLDHDRMMAFSEDNHRGTRAAKDWVTERFMFLFVNMLQLNWKSRPVQEQLHALRCLCVLLDFLHTNKATQFLPQVLATLNGAISDACKEADRVDLCMHAVKCLGKYVRIVAECNLEAVIDGNLTSIVVSVIPVIEDYDQKVTPHPQALREAVSLLEFLFDSDKIDRFPQAFSDIPFLPDSPSLRGIHQKLRAKGIVFDNLFVVSPGALPAGSQNDAKDEPAGSSPVSTKSLIGGRNVFALRKRLSLVSSLLENENSSVKGITLKHLHAILRSNRGLFHELIHAEGRASPKDFLTVLTVQGNQHGVITDLIEKLIRRFATEMESSIRHQIATCLGEIGAIAEHNLEGMALYRLKGDELATMHRWRLKEPPWRTSAQKYELVLVTKHLVLALKAATSAEEQVRIAHSIQQLLVLLDASARVPEDDERDPAKMSQWLHAKLTKGKVFEVVESFWFSEFSVKAEHQNLIRQPPFFRDSATYFNWVSNLSRWMIFEAHRCSRSPWKDFFFACRTAVKSLAGLETAEFVLPLLVCDRICFGSDQVFHQMCQEFRFVLGTNSEATIRMSINERRKAVNTLFQVIDTLKYWAEMEIEESCRSARRTTSSRNRSSKRKAPDISSRVSNWCPKQAILKLGEFLEDIPLLTQAKAALHVGMHATAANLLESRARQSINTEFFESTTISGLIDDHGSILQHGIESSLHASLAKKAYANLNDFETVDALNQDPFISSPLLDTDGIRAKEAKGDYELALQDYERALQVTELKNPDKEAMENEALSCLVVLGRFENILSSVEAKFLKGEQHFNSFALEAAWKLGKWDTLSELVEGNGVASDRIVESAESTYRTAIGKAIYSLHNKGETNSFMYFLEAREAVMGSLSSVATESYGKSYPDLLRLHEICEIEDVVAHLSRKHETSSISVKDLADDTWAWDGRLMLTTARGSSSILNTRLALSRLADDRLMESTLLFQIGRQARKNGLRTVAESFLCKAEASLADLSSQPSYGVLHLHKLLDQVRTNYAKLKKEAGENSFALKILGQDTTESAFKEMQYLVQTWDGDELTLKSMLTRVAAQHEKTRIEKMLDMQEINLGGDEACLADRFARRLLRLTEWTVDGGMHDEAILDRFKIVIKLSSQWEKGYFCYAKHLGVLVGHSFEKESMKEPREDIARFNAFYKDRTCQKYVLEAIKNYTKCLTLDSKHVYQALPRLLSLWFDFVSTQAPGNGPHSYSKHRIESLEIAQIEANKEMASEYKNIPSIAFYTAIPQLVSHLFDEGQETTSVLKKILDRVLCKHPEQAMWHLAWLTGSKIPERSRVGKEIFGEAQAVLSKKNKSDMVTLLRESGSLFKYFRDLARHTEVKASQSEMSLPPWKGQIGLENFVPPVQAALSVAQFEGERSGDHFPRNVPRIRAISSKVLLMNSKARPKKLVAYAVPGTWKKHYRQSAQKQCHVGQDIGQFHFLVKQEAKGDLRKDARVQEWNRVVNRLLDSNVNSKSSLASRSRRLRLRTFAVTCLSEDTGILEWVPSSDSLRNLVSESYNPQTVPLCPRRRGQRMTNFGDPAVRRNYEKCQDYFFKDGDLKKAALEYQKLCLKEMPPLLSWWFVRNFNDDAHAWYEARLRFTLSAAMWSAVGHVIGLGDRHSENILVETETGRLLHVDFDCIFDKGLNLPRPEVVPFRLTPNMIDAFGPTGANGMFKRGMEYSLEILRGNKDILLSVLEPFIKDPVIDWKRHRSQQSSSHPNQDSFHEARRSIAITRERLSGIYNLRNPNYKKFKNIILEKGSYTKETTMEVLPLSVEGQVQKLCLEATKTENLVQLYLGWMPWV